MHLRSRSAAARPARCARGWATALLLVGCGVQQGDPRCAAYAGTSTYGWCLTAAAGSLRDPAALDAHCGAAAPYERECRQRFVGAALQDPKWGRGELLGWCGDGPDCRLEVLEARPDPEVRAQLGLCAAHAGPLAADCATHALQRWATGAPTAGALAALAADPIADPALVGSWLGAVVACRGVGACPGAGPTAAACAEGLALLRAEPTRCPAAAGAQPARGLAAPPPGPVAPPGPGGVSHQNRPL
ncbi:MAG: hypothetical protein JNM72_02205 [Deltaproteobacteria bacterium]|nr:hypothetical protein [Deltaproteobacteria bacterium]